MKMQSFVMPAWMAGIQARRMRPDTSINLGPGSPCRDDESCVYVTHTNLMAIVHHSNQIFKGDRESNKVGRV